MSGRSTLSTARCILTLSRAERITLPAKRCPKSVPASPAPAHDSELAAAHLRLNPLLNPVSFDSSPFPNPDSCCRDVAEVAPAAEATGRQPKPSPEPRVSPLAESPAPQPRPSPFAAAPSAGTLKTQARGYLSFVFATPCHQRKVMCSEMCNSRRLLSRHDKLPATSRCLAASSHMLGLQVHSTSHIASSSWMLV